MTFTELLENQNMASGCQRENTYTDVTTTSSTAQQLTSYKEVCYQPIIGFTYITSLILIFIITFCYIYKFLNK